MLVRTFQLTAPRRSRPLLVGLKKFQRYFNSRLHEGADVDDRDDYNQYNISTHGSTKEPTAKQKADPICYTFQLTAPRRSRQLPDVDRGHTGTFQLTAPRRSRRIRVFWVHWTEKFQLTAPRRSRPQFQTKNTLLKLHNLYILYTFQLLTKFFDHFCLNFSHF